MIWRTCHCTSSRFPTTTASPISACSQCGSRGDEAPRPDQIYAIIEIADTSLPKDVGRKSRLYARFAIADYCVVDLNADALLHYREPHELGYAVCDRLTTDDHFELAALPDAVLEARAFLMN
jgi:hypothetical protein